MSKLIYAKSKSGFEAVYDVTARSLNGSVYNSIVFTEDGYLFTHGKYFRILPDGGRLFESTTLNGIATLKDTTLLGKTLGTINVGVTSVIGGDALSNTELTNGVVTINHDTSGVVAATYGTNEDPIDATVTIPSFTTDIYGHITSAASKIAIVNRVLATEATGTFYLLGHGNATGFLASEQALKIASIYGNSLGHLTANKFIGSLNNTLNITLNGGTESVFNNTANVYHSFYAPTTSGAANQILRSNGSGEPTWLSLSDSVSSGSTNSEIPSALAVYTAINTGISTNDAMVFKGVIDASTNPNYPSADKGWTYKISAAGRVGGASGAIVEAGDTIICTTDSSAIGTQETVGINWAVLQTNIDGAINSASVLSQGGLLVGTGTRAIQALSNGVYGNILISGGTSASPSWQTPGTFTLQVNGTTFGPVYSPITSKSVNLISGSNIALTAVDNNITISSVNTWRIIKAYLVNNTLSEILSVGGSDELQFGGEFVWDTVGDGTNGPELKLGWAEVDASGAITYTV